MDQEAFRFVACLPTLLAAEQDIPSKRGDAMPEQDLQSGMEGSANLLRANKVGIDAEGSVARPESTITDQDLFIQAEPN
jgi:hypothetical protein